MKKYIHVTSEDRQFLAKAFNVSSVTVWKALRFEQDTDTIRRIQKAARERGGIVMAVAPVMETLHDHDNVIRQYFPNGALLEISKNDSTPLRWCLCSCWATMLRKRAAVILISRETLQKASQWNKIGAY